MIKVGMMSYAHMHAYSYSNSLEKLPDAALVSIYDDNESRGTEAAVTYNASYYKDIDTFLQSDLDAVIICSENARHKELVEKAAEAKLPILCEKPLSVSVEDAESMIEVCKKHGVILQTAFPVRFADSIQKMKRQLDEGAFGDIIAIRSTNRGQNPGGWFTDPVLSGGGAVLDHTVHMVDIMRWFLGSEIKEVYSLVGQQFFSEEKTDDAGLLMLEFENGVIASHDTSWSRFSDYPAWGDAAIEIIGTKKRATADAFGHRVDHFRKEGKPVLTYRYGGNDIDFLLIRDFIQTVKEGKEPFITGYDGLKAMEAALKAYESAAKLAPVSFDEAKQG